MVLGGVLPAPFGQCLLKPAAGLELLVAAHQFLPLPLTGLEEEGLLARLHCLPLLGLQV